MESARIAHIQWETRKVGKERVVGKGSYIDRKGRRRKAHIWPIKFISVYLLVACALRTVVKSAQMVNGNLEIMQKVSMPCTTHTHAHAEQKKIPGKTTENRIDTIGHVSVAAWLTHGAQQMHSTLTQHAVEQLSS